MPLVDPVTMSPPAAAARRRRVAKTPEEKMSTPSTSTSTPSTSPPLSSISLAARHGGPLLLLAGLGLGLDSLVGRNKTYDANATTIPADGVTALAGLLAVSVVIQVLSAVLGLSPAGSDVLRKRRARKEGQPHVVVTTLLALLLTALAVPAVHLLLVLFGAPFLVHAPSTLLCAAHIALLGLFPAIFTRGTDARAWLALASGDLAALTSDATSSANSADALVTAAGLWGTAVGAWLGAVPIPLDWDRPWQRWPVTIVVGAYVGHAVGRLLGGALRRGGGHA